MEFNNEILEDVFRIARQVNANNITLIQGKNELVRSHGFNPNSATMMIRSLRHMINGQRYRRAMTVEATDYFLRRINEESGSEGLRIALQALSSHIEYRHSTGVNVPGLQSVLDKHHKYAH